MNDIIKALESAIKTGEKNGHKNILFPISDAKKLIEGTHWHKITDKTPDEDYYVITWNGSDFRVCTYKKVLTWKGYKFKFVNIMSKGFWNDDETHWTYFPIPPGNHE